MDSGFFEKNLLALSKRNSDLSARLFAATSHKYTFLRSSSGEIIPAIAGLGRSLHSTVDPKREARRLVSYAGEDASAGFWVFLGLGAGFTQEEALKTAGVCRVMVIEYDAGGVAQLFRYRDYTPLLEDPRFTLLVDPDPDLIEKTILEMYRPALYGGIKTLPLRPRIDIDKNFFTEAADAVQRAVEKTSADYSVQAHFGMRWFANIIRNLEAAGGQKGSEGLFGLQTVGLRTEGSLPLHAAICAAGPSLDAQIPLLAEQIEKKGSQKLIVISTDTAFPALLSRGVKPDAVVSIDCQHISYHHFMGADCRNIPLFLDISGPPILAGFSDFPFFFSGGHPLALYISRCWRHIPLLDTSGGNVTYACLSLAENLGARQITVYGADFSYPDGKIYTNGSYIFQLFAGKQNRLTPLEAQVSTLLFRNPFLLPEDAGDSHGNRRYETAILRFYRKAFEKKASGMNAEVSAAQGFGVPLVLHGKNRNMHFDEKETGFFAVGGAEKSPTEFLRQYRADIAALPLPSAGGAGTYVENLDTTEGHIAATLLPLAAAIKRRRQELDVSQLIGEVKRYSTGEIDKVLGLWTGRD